jgi:hypothetical protein
MIEIRHKDGAVLHTVNFDTLSGANLHGASLHGASLSKADLSWANLSWADLSGADLSAAELSGADLRWADLRCKQHVCQIHASRHAIVAIDDDVRIGCHRKLLTEWLETFQAVGRENKYTEAEIAEYGGWLRQIAAVLAARRGEVAG